MRCILILAALVVMLLSGCVSNQEKALPSNSSIFLSGSNCNNIAVQDTAYISSIMEKIKDSPTWCRNLDAPYYTPTKEEAMQNCYVYFASEFFGDNWTVFAIPTSSIPHWGKSAGENMNYYYLDAILIKKTNNIDSQGNIIENSVTYAQTKQVLYPILKDGRLSEVKLVEFECHITDKKDQ